MIADLGDLPGLLGESEDPRTVMEQSVGAVMDGVTGGDAVLPQASEHPQTLDANHTASPRPPRASQGTTLG